MLFVPADSERKLARAAEAGADALVLDLEDSVLPERKPLARTMMRAHLDAFDDHSRWWVRVNSLSSGELLADLVATVPARPFGIVLPKIFGPDDLVTVGHYLEALEVAHGLEIGAIRIAVLVTETPSAVLRLGELISRSYPRVTAVMWGAEDLSSAMGAGDPRDLQGKWRPTYEYARTQALLAAHALGVEAIDTVYVDFHDPDGLAASCAVSRHDGFTGRVAIHPNQVATLNKAYSPDAIEIELAQRIVAAFASGAGAVAIDGKMYDIPHLKAANRLLATLEVSHG
ncbi:HpcH/HpaI aldolase/citrate lyase family protein [Pseudomonas umsongensis]|uniref:HpcH/HpaI aldolase/citrate lyase family protein n=1 Tax=Pseudomonas umsongensis TaxID=198618 RepID=UPI00200B8637|nr:CoA ester lyase [Pseudomonas umsongensis]MCK8683311.1 CoA ester lyase [Pseudomonas umsongensis]